MKPLGISLATGMFAITVIAVNLAAFRYLAWPVLDFTPLHLSLSLLPMGNALAILGYRFMRNPEGRHPFATGFFVFGLIAMLAHVACVSRFPEQIKWTYIIPIGPLFQLCKTYRVPFYVGVSHEGYSYFRYYPALILVNFGIPQFIAACLGGLFTFSSCRDWTERESQHPEPSQARRVANGGNSEA